MTGVICNDGSCLLFILANVRKKDPVSQNIWLRKRSVCLETTPQGDGPDLTLSKTWEALLLRNTLPAALHLTTFSTTLPGGCSQDCVFEGEEADFRDSGRLRETHLPNPELSILSQQAENNI